MLESFEYFCKISSTSILIISSYTVSKLVVFLRHSVYCIYMVVPCITFHKTYFKVAMHTYRVLHGGSGTPHYLQQIMCTSNIPSWHRLWSSLADSLFVPVVWMSTVVCCTFPVAGARVWNNLPSDTLPPHRCCSLLSSDWKGTYFVTRTRDNNAKDSLQECRSDLHSA